MNATLTLENAVLDTELRYVNFFNGRLLSGEDLSDERDATRAQSRHLGLALGSGIAFGLEVTLAPKSSDGDIQVRINGGLAVNHEGEVLRLACPQVLALTVPLSAADVAGCVFTDCSALPASSSLTGDGFYLLTIAPASANEGLAPVSGLGNAPAACNSRYLTEGVQFRLVPLTAQPISDLAHARNELSYQCFGTSDSAIQAFFADPFTATLSTYGLVDHADPQRLTPEDVPLAVIAFDASDGLQFIDRWAVRRRLVRPSPDQSWPLLVNDRRITEGEAMYLQFQEQLSELAQGTTPMNQIVASQSFTWLPPAGLLPLDGAASIPGIDTATFFQGQAYNEPVFIDSSLIVPLIRSSFAYQPIGLAQNDPIRLYRPVQNGVALPFLLFATVLLPYDASARWDIARWDLANFS